MRTETSVHHDSRCHVTSLEYDKEQINLTDRYTQGAHQTTMCMTYNVHENAQDHVKSNSVNGATYSRPLIHEAHGFLRNH